MKSATKRFATFLADPKSILFGAAILILIWVWLRSPNYRFPINSFLAFLLLASSILIGLNKRWSNLVASVLSGYLPVEVLREFWTFPGNADVPMFSAAHFRYFFGNLYTSEGVVIFLAVAVLMLARSTYAVIHNDRSETGTEDRAR